MENVLNGLKITQKLMLTNMIISKPFYNLDENAGSFSIHVFVVDDDQQLQDRSHEIIFLLTLY